VTILYPTFLWLLIPILVLFFQNLDSFKNRIHIIILFLVILSISRPVIKESPKEIEIEGKNIIIALDVSYSMNARDVKPNRYEFAKSTILSLLKLNPNDNIMLIVFTSNPLILSPATTDHPLIEIALNSLKREFIMTKGTSLENLFKKVVSINIGSQNLILITDGGEEEDINSDILKSSNISLTILAMGSKEGSIIQNRDNRVLKNEEGELVISRINPLLKSLTTSYFTASNSPQDTANKIYKSIDKKAQKSKKMQYSYLELYQIPLFLAMILFFMLHTRWVTYLKNSKLFNLNLNIKLF